MARRRKQTHDPRQLSFFDIMANQIEEIREENIQDDMREENISIPAAQVEQAVPAMPLQVEPVKEDERQPEPAREEKPFSFPHAKGTRDALASMEGAIPYMSCKTVPACTAPTRTSCSSLTVKKEHLKNCLRPELMTT